MMVERFIISLTTNGEMGIDSLTKPLNQFYPENALREISAITIRRCLAGRSRK